MKQKTKPAKPAKAKAKAEAAPAAPLLGFWAEGFIYRDKQYPLKGRALEVLKALSSGEPGNVVTVLNLQDDVWKSAGVEPKTIGDAVKRTREALREAMREANIDRPRDPIPQVDQGNSRLAWRLNLG